MEEVPSEGAPRTEKLLERIAPPSSEPLPPARKRGKPSGNEPTFA